MYFTGVGWVRFEPTPSARAGATPPWTRQSADTADADGRPERGCQPGVGPEARRGGRSRRSPTATSSCRVPPWPLIALAVLLVLGLVPALVRVILRRRRLSVRRSRPSRRRGLGRAARDRTRPGAGLARATFTARAGPQRGRPGAGRGRRTSSRWRGCWSGWSGDATAGRRPATLGRTLGWTLSTRSSARARWRRSSRGAGRWPAACSANATGAAGSGRCRWCGRGG